MTAHPLGDAIEWIQGQIRTISGIRAAPNEPPNDMNAYPYVVAYEGPGEFWYGDPAGQYKGLHQVIIELHVARKDLPRDVTKLRTYFEPVAEKIMADPTWGGTIDTIQAPINHSGLVALGWNDKTPTIGYAFRVTVKIHNNI